MSTQFTESTVEAAALAWLEAIGWQVAHGPDIAPPCLPAGRDMPAAERADYGEVALARRLRDALARLNPALPAEVLEDAFRKLTRPDLPAGQAGNKHSRRPDVVLFVNGLPLAVLEFKNAANEDATIWTAFQQLQTYKAAPGAGQAVDFRHPTSHFD